MAKIPEFSDAELAAYSLRMEQLKILRRAADGTLPRAIRKDSALFSYAVLAELYDAGFVKAVKHPAYVNPGFFDIEITLPGRQFMATLEQTKPEHAADPSNREPPDIEKPAHEPWHKRPLGDIWLGIVKGLLVAAAVSAIAHWVGVL